MDPGRADDRFDRYELEAYGEIDVRSGPHVAREPSDRVQVDPSAFNIQSGPLPLPPEPSAPVPGIASSQAQLLAVVQARAVAISYDTPLEVPIPHFATTVTGTATGTVMGIGIEPKVPALVSPKSGTLVGLGIETKEPARSAPDSAAAVPDIARAAPDVEPIVPDSEARVPDSKPIAPDHEAEVVPIADRRRAASRPTTILTITCRWPTPRSPTHRRRLAAGTSSDAPDEVVSQDVVAKDVAAKDIVAKDVVAKEIVAKEAFAKNAKRDPRDLRDAITIETMRRKMTNRSHEVAMRERRALVATTLLAFGVPLGTASYVHARVDDVADELSSTAGVPARIGRVDADLTGAVRLSDVALGRLVEADTIEASVAMDSLLGGQMRADEIRVTNPRVAIRVDADGDSDLARVARKLVHPGSSPTPHGDGESRGVRRIVVDGGTLVANVAGVGELSAEGVELLPDGDGVRVITGRVGLRGGTPSAAVDVTFARSAAELGLQQMRFGRVLAVGGTGSVTIGGGTVKLLEIAAGRRGPRGALEVHAMIDDAGIPRPLGVEVAPIAHRMRDGVDTLDLAVTLHGDRIPLRPLAPLAPHGVDVAGTHATGTLTIHRFAPVDGRAVANVRRETIEVAGAGKLDNLVVDHAAFSGGPVPLTVGVNASVALSPEAIAVSRVEVELGAIKLDANGWIRRGGPVAGQLDVHLAPAPCADLLGSLPDAVRGPLDGMAMAGTFGGRVRLAVDLASQAGDGVALARSLTGECHVLAEPPAADVTSLAEASEQQLADGSRARIGKGEANWVPMRDLPSHLTAAFVAAEDAQFWDHDGFDLEQIARSLEIDLREQRLARGGSTISQQLVKNAFLTQRRSVDRKIQEAVLAWRLEARLGKRQILERYLNIVELGPHVFGVGAAARYWFDTTADKLTVHQAAFLAAITSQPTSAGKRIRKAGGLDAETAERVAVILRAMRRSLAVDASTLRPLTFAPAVIDRE